MNSSSPATSVAELTALAKARPGALKYGVSGIGDAACQVREAEGLGCDQRGALCVNAWRAAGGRLRPARYESITKFGAFAPAGTPRNVIDRLNSEIVRFLTRPEVKEKLFNSSLETAGGSPEQFATIVKSELLRMSKVIKDAGIRAE